MEIRNRWNYDNAFGNRRDPVSSEVSRNIRQTVADSINSSLSYAQIGYGDDPTQSMAWMYYVDGESRVSDSNEWVDATNTAIGSAGSLAAFLQYSSGRTSVGSNWRFYRSGWGGNQFVATARISSIAAGVGHTTLYLSLAVDMAGVFNYYDKGSANPNAVHPAKAGVNLGVGLWAARLGPYGAIPAAIYFGVDAFYPGGWPAAIQMQSDLIERNQEILGPSFNLYRD